MIPRQNEITGMMEVHIPAKITEIRNQVLKLNNEKKTPYKLGNCDISYPDGGVESVLTRFYMKTLEKHPESFKVGNRISLAIQTEGIYAGRAVAHLSSTTVDVARLLGKATTTIPSTEAVNTQKEVQAVV
jgi:hypothetical protein